MPRGARQRSKSGIYHVMVRGINRQDIFLDDEDRVRYLYTLRRVKERSGCQIYSYCLMDNHVHLLLAEGKEDVAQVMKRLGSSYVYWYNKKYQRVGHLFQDRFASEPVEDDGYFIAVLRYIHQNPTKAGLTLDCSSYRWSSYHAYLTGQDRPKGLTDVTLALDILHGSINFHKLHQVETVGQDFLDIDEASPMTDEELEQTVIGLLVDRSADEIKLLPKYERNLLLRELKNLPGVSARQIARVIGLDRKVIDRA